MTDNKHKADFCNRYNPLLMDLLQNFQRPLEVNRIVNKLKPGKDQSPDNISNWILRETSPALAEPLSILFNKCIAKGTFPVAWKQANVILLSKKGDMTQCNNYLPVSLLPCISKVFEKNIFQHLVRFLKNQNIVSSKQSGFIPGNSTTNQLSIICHNIYSSLDSADEIHGVDFSKTKFGIQAY